MNTEQCINQRWKWAPSFATLMSFPSISLSHGVAAREVRTYTRSVLKVNCGLAPWKMNVQVERVWAYQRSVMSAMQAERWGLKSGVDLGNPFEKPNLSLESWVKVQFCWGHLKKKKEYTYKFTPSCLSFLYIYQPLIPFQPFLFPFRTPNSLS